MGGLFKTPKAPPQAETPKAPAPDDKESERAARRVLAQIQARSGRQSTVLSNDFYGSSKLGVGGG